MKISKLKYFILLILVFLGILIFVNVREAESEGLKAMLANPVANMQLTTAKEVYRYQDDKGVTLGKPGYAMVDVTYEPIGNNTTGDVYDEIVDNIENSEWEKRDITSWLEGEYYVAKTYYGTSNRVLLLEVFNNQDLGSVTVSMTAR